MATYLEKSKNLNEVNKRLHFSTNPESLVKIGLLGSELPGLVSRPLKILKINKTLAKYIAFLAILPSGINYVNFIGFIHHLQSNIGKIYLEK